LRKIKPCGTVVFGKGGEGQGRATPGKLELNPADGIITQKVYVMATTPTKKKPKKKMTKTS
jgi:hypothetical protein